MKKTISIIIPSFQHAHTITLCLDSIFSQTLQPDEIIVVDDGSTDSTQIVLQPYTDKITIIKQTNQGAPIARNNGFNVSNGDFVMFCDADVIMKPNMLETLYQTLCEYPKASFVYSGFLWGNKLFTSQPFDQDKLRQVNYIHTSALIRREAFPGFDPTLKRFQDWDLWLTMLAQNKTGVFVNQCLFKIILDKNMHRISRWVPKFMYKIPWSWIGWKPNLIKKFDEAKEIIIRKHHS